MAIETSTVALRVLRAVIDTGSLTGAAERLGYTQSAVSKQVRSLETAAGQVLFVRGARGVTATPAGLALGARALSALDQLDLADRELADLSAPVVGRVLLGGFATAAVDLVPRAIARVRREHPGIEVDFLETSTPSQIRRLRSGRIDLALLGVGEGLPDWDLSGIRTEELPVGPLRVAVSAGHRLARRASEAASAGRVGVDEFAEEDWIVGRGSSSDPQFGAWPTLPDPRVTARIADWITRLGFVAAGIGITTVPSLALPALPPGVVTVGVDDPRWRGRGLRLAWVGRLSAEAGVLRQALRERAAWLAAPASEVTDRA